MNYHEEDKEMFYLEAIISEKKRIEDDIRHKETQIRNGIGIIFTIFSMLLALIGLYLSYKLKHPLSFLLVIIFLLMGLYILYRLDMLFAERRQLNIIKNTMYLRYIKALDDIIRDKYDISKMRETYLELRELEIKDIVENRPEYQIALKLSKTFNVDIEEMRKIVAEYIKEKKVTKFTYGGVYEFVKELLNDKEKLKKILEKK